MAINKNKTKLIYFTLKDIPEENSTSCKVKPLGMTLDDKLSWKPHILISVKKPQRVVVLLRKLKSSVSNGNLLLTFCGPFHSHLNYGLHHWGNSSHAKICLKGKNKQFNFRRPGHQAIVHS